MAPEFLLTPELYFQFLFLAVLLRRRVREAGWASPQAGAEFCYYFYKEEPRWGWDFIYALSHL